MNPLRKAILTVIAAIGGATLLLGGGSIIFSSISSADGDPDCVRDRTELNERQQLGLTPAQIEEQCDTGTTASSTTVPQTTASTTASTQQAAPSDQCPFVHMNAGETKTVEAGHIVQGDVIVDGKKLYDDNSKTGLLVVLHQTAQVTAPYEAEIEPLGDPNCFTVEQAKEQMSTSGCENNAGCTTVNVVEIGQSQTAAAPASGQFECYESEGGIPFSPATGWRADVAPDEVEVFTGGPMKVAGIKLPGGTNRGSVVLFLPSPDRVIDIAADEVKPGSNWHCAMRPVDSPREESTWRAIADFWVSMNKQAPNCTPGKGCTTVDVLIVDNGKVIARWTS